MSKPIVLQLSLATIMALSVSAATVIPLNNANFDIDTYTDGGIGSLTGWMTMAGSSGFNPAAAAATPTSGENVAFSNSGTAFIIQSTGHALLVDTAYTVTVNVGRQAASVPELSWRVQLVTLNGANITDFAQAFFDNNGPAVSSGTLNGTTSVAYIYGGETAAGTLDQVTLTWMTGAAPTGLGDNLTVRLYGGGGDQAIFDNVALSYVAIPEPSSLALMGLGGLCVLRRRRV